MKCIPPALTAGQSSSVDVTHRLNIKQVQQQLHIVVEPFSMCTNFVEKTFLTPKGLYHYGETLSGSS